MRSKQDGTVQMCFENDGSLKVYYDGRCKRCGRPFHKLHNKSQYCSEECAKNNIRDLKARYQRRRRLLVKNKHIILSEKQKYGLGSYGTCSRRHRKKDFKEEYTSIQKEFRRLKLRRDY